MWSLFFSIQNLNLRLAVLMIDYQKGYEAGLAGKKLPKSVPTAFYRGWTDGKKTRQKRKKKICLLNILWWLWKCLLWAAMKSR